MNCDCGGGEHGPRNCDCGGSGYGLRNFLTKEEKLEILKEYKESLENEIKGVGERIKQLEGSN